MIDLPKRLRASLRCDAINGDSFERSVCAKQMREAADTLDRADARIAELERDNERIDAQWRDELRIYRETENKRIAELERSVTVRDTEVARLETDLELARMTERERICSAIKATDDAASECGYMLDSDDCIAVARGELGPANYEDAARAGNGGGV